MYPSAPEYHLATHEVTEETRKGTKGCVEMKNTEHIMLQHIYKVDSVERKQPSIY